MRIGIIDSETRYCDFVSIEVKTFLDRYGYSSEILSNSSIILSQVSEREKSIYFGKHILQPFYELGLIFRSKSLHTLVNKLSSYSLLIFRRDCLWALAVAELYNIPYLIYEDTVITENIFDHRLDSCFIVHKSSLDSSALVEYSKYIYFDYENSSTLKFVPLKYLNDILELVGSYKNEMGLTRKLLCNTGHVVSLVPSIMPTTLSLEGLDVTYCNNLYSQDLVSSLERIDLQIGTACVIEDSIYAAICCIEYGYIPMIRASGSSRLLIRPLIDSGIVLLEDSRRMSGNTELVEGNKLKVNTEVLGSLRSSLKSDIRGNLITIIDSKIFPQIKDVEAAQA